ncbi:GNAT family N-acetyltransferase [Desulforamulus aquiferis]|uniref:GNAT family N-acetyltransferase n=1 Tax=Desulforamulus aquiferis TaxID=1397668 RepID=A0AAW7Z8D4_9FIRM|nr:GNAT family N-acetyltransferase [Desulforamulus aquiferis]MDO7786068.1 GNAT family N-acetyltransferase [Desulforamulus aquiferis]
MNGEVRLINYDELPKLLQLYKLLHPEDPDILNTSNLLSIWDEIYKDANLYYLVIEENKELISSCTLAIIKNLTRNARPYGLIENVITHPNYRRRGYGKRVIIRATDICRENNCYKVMLLTGSKKDGTLSFYESCGFVRGLKTGFVRNL